MSPGFRPAAFTATIAAGACLALGGCSAEVNVGGGSDASGKEIAGEIRDDYAKKTGIALRDLTCEDVKPDVGEKFSCSGRNAHGVQVQIAGRVTDTSGGGFDYSWHVAKAIAPGVLYERALRRHLEESGVAISEVRCPVEVEVTVGATLRCTATDGNGSTRAVTLRLTDLDGGFEYSVAGENSAEGEGSSSARPQ